MEKQRKSKPITFYGTEAECKKYENWLLSQYKEVRRQYKTPYCTTVIGSHVYTTIQVHYIVTLN